ncbi:putative RNA-directed DNA polymerase from transposon X-element-like Protein [Tribolium castaneum]|uniref:Putative RNA-directed DNA polymerase from transposon X-element-like Protein n=1 Tax=Tribolium castaneum TaxID=7070 RepID=D6WFI9_TRICA|nr:putative RNA-directed DNA polymerase from transposon X-element-like Protein [Tribolium castaneum]
MSVFVPTSSLVANESSNTKYRPITTLGLFHLYNFIENINWDFINNTNNDVEDLFTQFNSILVHYVSICFPEKIFSTRASKNWFNDNLRALRNMQTLLFQLQNKQIIDKEVYTDFRKFYRSEIAKALVKFHDNMINNVPNKQKALWDIVNTKRKNSVKLPTNLSPDTINNYFTNIAANTINALPKTSNILTSFETDSRFSFHEVSYNEVRDAINHLKKSNSRDAYNISSKILKSLVNLIVIPLTKIINRECIRESIFPAVLKTSKVVPVFKKGDPNDISNYRPISLVPILAKVFEFILKKQINSYFENNSLYSQFQFGFRCNHSTSLAINYLSEKILSSFENKENTYVCCLDLTKAFDCVEHGILLQKLKSYGFCVKSISLMNSYLINRCQFVSAHNINSNKMEIKFGVPQGSVLGPTLFLIFINDLPLSIKDTNFLLFADDTTIYGAFDLKEALDHIKTCVETKIKDWFIGNKLTVNCAKTQEIIFSLNKSFITPSYIKLLGVFLDCGLTWETHCNYFVTKLSKKLFLFRQLVID